MTLPTKTKIIATLGPATTSPEMLEKVLASEVDIVRMNLSHGTINEHKEIFDRVRALDENVSIMFDLSGPKIRLGEFKEPTQLVSGQEFVLTKDSIIGNSERATINPSYILDDLREGNLVFMNDGLVTGRVVEKLDDGVKLQILGGGMVSSRKGVNFPGVQIRLYAPTEKDLRDLDATVGLEPDFYSVSFVRRIEDLQKVRGVILSHVNHVIPLISKIEHHDAVKSYHEILRETDAVMVARGDLGLEIPPETVPGIQKQLVHEANLHVRPVIVATQMLESMVRSPLPTRAEVSDVANAILDGADAIMLSGETATGKYPLEAIEMMARISREVESFFTPNMESRIVKKEYINPTRIGKAAVQLAFDTEAAVILAFTQSGTSPLMVSTYRPRQPVLVFSSDIRVLRRTSIQWGVVPVYTELDPSDSSKLIKKAITVALEKDLVSREDTFVLVSGSLFGKPTKTNSILFETVDKVLSRI